MKNIVFAVMSILISLSACKNGLKQELLEQQERLMTLHDEVMPKSMRTDKLKSELQSLANEVESDSLKQLIADNAIQLQEANDDMYAWMKDFGVAMNETPNLDEQKARYDQLEPEIIRIKEKTNEQIEKAEKILKK